MKKVMSILLAAMTVAGVSSTVFADNLKSNQSAVEVSEEPILISTWENEDIKDNNLIIAGKDINIGNIGVLIKNNVVMVPVKATAEKLGFEVVVDKNNKSASLKNKEIETEIYIGEDSYYYSSVDAIGMSAPTQLGAAPVVVDDNIYVPIKLYNMLLNDENAVGSFFAETKDKEKVYIEKGDITTGWKLINNKWYFMNNDGMMQNGWIQSGGNWYYLFEDGEMAEDTVTPDGYTVDKSGKWDFKDPIINNSLENPIEEFTTIDEAQKVLNFKIIVPKKVPAQFKMESINTISRSAIGIGYSNGEDKILFRMGQGIEDVSGDYTQYESINKEEINGVSINLSGNNKLVNLATWTVDNMSYSIMTDKGMTKESILEMVKSTLIVK